MVALGGQGQACIFCVRKPATTCNGLFGGSGAALGAISANFQPAHDDVEAAVALNLAFQAVEKITLKFHDFATAQARHMNVISLGTALVEMFFTLHVHEIEFIDQAMAFEKAESAVHRHAVDSWIEFAGVSQNLRGVEMLLRSFHHAQDRSSLMSEAYAARGERSLQSTRGFGCGKRHMKLSCN
jgi:hypothetical protein